MRRRRVSAYSDAKLWVEMLRELRGQDWMPVEQTRGLELTARRLVAVVRRERDTVGAATWAPGDIVPDHVKAVYDLDGDRWERHGPDLWRICRFNSTEMEGRAGTRHTTDALLARYGPVTEVISDASYPKQGGRRGVAAARRGSQR